MDDMTILIVEDVRMSREMFRSALEIDGYHVLMAANGQEAMAQMRENQVDMILLDWMTPVMDGLEFIQWLRTQETEHYIYVIMVTARNRSSDLVTAMDAGVDDYMGKPIRMKELRARVSVGARYVQMERKQRETTDRMERAKREWEATVDALPHLICMLDTEGRIVRTNRTVENWGLEWLGEAAGQTLPDVFANVYPNFAKEIGRMWEEATEQTRKGFHAEFHGFDNKTGHHFTVRFDSVDPYKEHQTDISSYAVAIIEDTTKRRQLEDRLKEALASLGQTNGHGHGDESTS